MNKSFSPLPPFIQCPMPNKSVKVDRSQEPNLTSQEYREDERRRREFLYESQDMMADSSTDYDPTQHLEDLEEGEIPAPVQNVTEEDSGEEYEEPRASQYVPPSMMVEKRRRLESEEEEEEVQEAGNSLLDIDSSDEESDFNTPEITMKEHWVGQKENSKIWNSAKVMFVPESKSKFVGIRPKPTNIVKPTIDIVQVINIIVIIIIIIVIIVIFSEQNINVDCIVRTVAMGG